MSAKARHGDLAGGADERAVPKFEGHPESGTGKGT